jgi:Collagen triple helix repeat (20 copies)
MSLQTTKGFPYPQYSDTPDVPRDIYALAYQLDTYLTSHSGSQGITGSTGAQGLQGLIGLQGASGSGSQGIQGSTGSQGLQGAQGSQGATGNQGTVGTGITILGKYNSLSDLQTAYPTGTSGQAYLVGTDLYVWDSVNSIWSNAGSITGVQGLTGSQGIQGAQGIQGIQGLVGNQGTLGQNGAQGTQGQQGTIGAQGTQGIQGIQGASVQGAQGTTGAQGISGIQGGTAAQGIQGLQGVQGANGQQGTIGAQGTQGIQGIQGASVQGAQGTTGAQGAGSTPDYTLIAVADFSSHPASTYAFTSLSGYNKYMLVAGALYSGNYGQMNITLNGDTGSNYYYALAAPAINQGQSGYIIGGPNDYGTLGWSNINAYLTDQGSQKGMTLYIDGAMGSGKKMIWGFQYGYKYEYPVYIPALGYFAGAWTGSAVSSITVNNNATWTSGNIYLYGSL